ncbi:uncharacterized protein LOC113870170 [Abrus precatorius]|uniref:Uncharacterized protein LOC113870170 n=1 Tax=Abrus precatorius TaxID=3816 RepID=A0A8B8M5Y8_ABRPR|nr:uncharacterized protein LOC113870170 [Abrus precatorius]
MPFGLKNAGATYQRLMNKIFEKQVGKCIEVHVDDMVIKYLALKQHLDHLEEVFGEARKHGMRFYPEKCTFGVIGGKFLGFMLSKRGIEANPDKCRAIIDMASPRNVKDVQQLTGRIAALARFLPIMAESGAGVILEGPNAFAIEQSIRFEFKASNNQAEYEALLAGLRLAKEMGVKRITSWSDSKIVTEQVNDTYQVRDSVMLKYYQEFKKIKAEFEEVCIRYTPRNMNERADRLARLASQRKPGQLQSVVHQEIIQPSIARQECMDIENLSHNWMTPLIRYLTDGNLPEDTASAKKIKAHAAKYLLLGKELYRRGISTPMLKCLDDDQANYVIREIHESICGTHSDGRTMAAKVLSAGYYWPTITQDCHLFVKQYIPCQQHGPHLHQHADTVRHISSPWPFAIWEMDLLGPFLLAKGQCKFLLVTVDYFTKWIEAEPLATITANNVKKFTWKNIITQFGLPHALITDNGFQFTDRRFNKFLEGLHIKHRVTSVEHPQTNGQAETANKVILHELKRRLGSAKGEWAEKLPEILWAYRCTPQTTTKETPFRLTYGTDASRDWGTLIPEGEFRRIG